jgi:hypothetical protein
MPRAQLLNRLRCWLQIFEIKKNRLYAIDEMRSRRLRIRISVLRVISTLRIGITASRLMNFFLENSLYL